MWVTFAHNAHRKYLVKSILVCLLSVAGEVCRRSYDLKSLQVCLVVIDDVVGCIV